MGAPGPFLQEGQWHSQRRPGHESRTATGSVLISDDVFN